MLGQKSEPEHFDIIEQLFDKDELNDPVSPNDKRKMFWTDWFFNEKDRKSRNTEKVKLFTEMSDESVPGPVPAIADEPKTERSKLAYRSELNKIVVDVQKAKNRISDIKKRNESELRQIELIKKLFLSDSKIITRQIILILLFCVSSLKKL